MKEFNDSDARKMWEVCVSFIKEHEIRCAETIYQCDGPQIAATEFIEILCETIGYLPNEDDSE